MNEKYLVIVESPTKARTIARFLPKNFIVEASIGHIRDLPQTAADIPASKKSLDWARLGINVENSFEPLYITPKGKGKIINNLKKKLKEVKGLYLATDEDREGESISWHLVQVLRPEKYNIPVKRMTFHEITKKAISEALKHTRDINMNLVRAQETRRILDRLYGFTLSPLIWKKIAYGLSAGRVQSPGLRMIVEREHERTIFQKAVYWDLRAELSLPETNRSGTFEARLIKVNDRRLATGKDFHSIKGHLLRNDSLILTEESAVQLEKELMNGDWRVIDLKEEESSNRPAAPFITSTLQQEGNRKLGLSARETMYSAQKLYEEGLITYMRTDSPTLSDEAITGARKVVEELYGKDYLSASPRKHNSKSKNVQEAHEAIRPAGSRFAHPDETNLIGRERNLYEIIWKRTLASQMAESRKSSTVVRIQVKNTVFQTNGTRILFPGFLKLYIEEDAKERTDEITLPNLKVGDSCMLHSLKSLRHETRPPARYTEASIIQELEKKGIGRPSTYSSIIGTLFDRNYVRKVGGALIPSYTGMAVSQFLEKNFAYLVKYNFTSDMETNLDRIALDSEDRLSYLHQFYLGQQGLKKLVEERELNIKPEESRRIILPQVNDDIEIRIGRFGPYIIATGPNGEKVNASIPEDIAPSNLSKKDIDLLIEIELKEPEPIGIDPETGKAVFCLNGRYGFYVQLGEANEDNPKPRRASIPRGINPREVSLEVAMKYLSIPRNLGLHPETGKEVMAGIGRFGPFVVHDNNFRSIKKDDDVYSITLSRALELLKEGRKKGRLSNLIRELGILKGKKVDLYSGKYGPYIKYGTKNVSLPNEKESTEELAKLTIDDAIRIIADK